MMRAVAVLCLLSILIATVQCQSPAIGSNVNVYLQYQSQIVSETHTECVNAVLNCTVFDGDNATAYQCNNLLNGTAYINTGFGASTLIRPLDSLVPTGQYCYYTGVDNQLPLTGNGIGFYYHAQLNDTEDDFACSNLYDNGGPTLIDTVNGQAQYTYSTNASAVPVCPITTFNASIPTTLVYFSYKTNFVQNAGSERLCGTATLNCSVVGVDMYECFQLVGGYHFYYGGGFGGQPTITPLLYLVYDYNDGFETDILADNVLPIDGVGFAFAYLDTSDSILPPNDLNFVYLVSDGAYGIYDMSDIYGGPAPTSTVTFSTNQSVVGYPCPLNGEASPYPPVIFTGNICAFLQGVPGTSPWASSGTSGWSAILQASITYSFTPNSFNPFTSTSLGSYVTLNSVTSGSISIYSPFVSTTTGTQAVVTSPIVQLVTTGSSGVSNVIYSSSTSPLDGNGIGLVLGDGIEFPGQTSTSISNLIDLYFTIDPVTGYQYPRIQGFGLSSETNASFLTDVTGVSSTFAPRSGADISSPTACAAALSAVNPSFVPTSTIANTPQQPPVTASVQLNYTSSDNATYITHVVLILSVIQSGATDVYGVSHSVVTVTGGTRFYGYGTPANGYTSSTTTASINTGSCLTANQYLYGDVSQYPYIDASGIQFSVRPSQPLIGLSATTASRKVSTFTVFADPTTSSIQELPTSTPATPRYSTISFTRLS